MDIRIHAPRDTYIDGETIQLEVELRNTGAAPLSLPLLDDPFGPQPYFVIQGASYRNPYRFHWTGSPPSGSQPPREFNLILPGQAVSEVLGLPASLAFPSPGPHELYATYEAGGVAVESNRVKVRIDDPRLRIFRWVGRTPQFSELAIQALSVSGGAFYLASFNEERPDLGETSFAGLDRLASIDPDAADVFAPWCQTAQAGVIGPRFGWRTGNRLTVVGYRKLPQRLELMFTPRVFGPSLMGANGDIDLLFTDSTGLRLALARFPNVGYDQTPPAARLVWSTELTEPITDLVSTINPAGLRAAVLRQGGNLRLLTWTDTGPQLEPPVVVEGRPLPAVAPALHLSASGVARASVLTTDPQQARKVVLTEITWVKGAAPSKKADPAIELQSAIRSGTIAYSMSAVEQPRRDWYFVLDSHRVQSSRSGGKARVTKREVLIPPLLLVMSDVTYNLEIRQKPELNMID